MNGSEPREAALHQQIAAITLGVSDLGRSRRFYVEGFGWRPVFENAEIIFYQMNGLMLGTWLRTSLSADMQREEPEHPGGVALAHNVLSADQVQAVIERLARAGGDVLRQADAPPHGGVRGYVADPDGHAWEIAWNPAWRIDEHGLVTFGV